jgi:hypothetical protein
MKLNNKGFWCIPHCCIVAVKVIAPKAIATSTKVTFSGLGLWWLLLILALPCIWHVPHWESCKHMPLNSPERALCQAQPMWPVK